MNDNHAALRGSVYGEEEQARRKPVKDKLEKPSHEAVQRYANVTEASMAIGHSSYSGTISPAGRR